MHKILAVTAQSNASAEQYGSIASQFAGAGTYEEAHHELFRVSPEVSSVHLAYTLIAIFTVLFGTFSAFIKEKLFAGEAIIALAIGIAFGPYGANIFSPSEWAEGRHTDDITLEITRVVIALSVFAVGVELPRAYVWKHWKSLSILLGPTMLIGWLVSAAFIYGLIPGLHFLDSLVIAACVTPTDPILAASVVGKGKFARDHVPAHIRHILQAESGSNDGAAFPFLYFAMFWILRDGNTVGQAIGWWVVLVVLYQIVLGVIIGAMVGIIARKTMKFAKYRDLIDRESMVAMYVALALLVTGATTLAGSDDLLAAFACGTAFAWDDWFSESIEDSNFSSILDLLVNCTIFFYIGATIPFDSWADASLTIEPWRLVVIGILVLLFRRIPVIFALQKFIPDIRTMREAIFVGHFGPMGVGALFISTLARMRLPTPAYPPENHLDILSLSIEPIVYFLILVSVLVHGLSIPVFTNGRRLHKRVSSFSRTFTANSTSGDNEPSWLSRVRRVGDKEDRKSSGEDEARLGATDSSSGPTPSAGSDETPPHDTEADVLGSHDKILVETPTGIKEETEWREGSDVIREDESGESVHTESASEAGSSRSRNSTKRKLKSKSKKQQQDEAGPDMFEADAKKVQDGSDRESSPSDNERKNKGKDHERRRLDNGGRGADTGALWKRDEKTGLPRELTSRERRKAKEERDVRRERHYCNREDDETTWQEGNRIIVEKNDGETVAIHHTDDIEATDPDTLKRLMATFPGLTRLTTALTQAVHSSKGTPDHDQHKSALDQAFGNLQKNGPRSVQASPPKSDPSGSKRPGLQSMTTAVLKDKLLRRKTVAEEQEPVPDAGPSVMRERPREGRAGIRFNLPRDDQLKRYDLAE